MIILDNISVSANETNSCCNTNSERGEKKKMFHVLFIIGHNCPLLITSASRYQYPLPSNSLVYLYRRKHRQYHGSPNYITCHADILTEFVKNTSITFHLQVHTLTQEPCKPGRYKAWCALEQQTCPLASRVPITEHVTRTCSWENAECSPQPSITVSMLLH